MFFLLVKYILHYSYTYIEFSIYSYFMHNNYDNAYNAYPGGTPLQKIF